MDNLPEHQNRANDFSREVVRAALVDIVSKSLLLAAGSGAAAVGLLIWQGGSIPAWIAALIVLLAVAGGYVSWRRYRTLRRGLKRRDDRIAELEPIAARVPDLDEQVEGLEYAVTRYDVYQGHIALMLDHLQRVVAGDIDIPIPDYISRGILEPAREVLSERPDEQVRLSVLLPDGDDFIMAFSAGHNLNSQSKYRQPIDGTLAGITLREGRMKSWDDVTTDVRFAPNPMATRPIHSMVSVPIATGDHVIGVFNVVSSAPFSFDAAEEQYIQSLGSVISVAVCVHLSNEGIAVEPDSADDSGGDWADV